MPIEASGFTVQRYASAEQFLKEAAPWLLAGEAENNVVLAVAQLLVSDDHPFHEPVYLGAVKEGDRIVGCAVLPPPDHLDMTFLPAGAASLLVDSVAGVHADLTEVAGPPEPAAEFARTWTRERGGHWRVRHTWTWFQLQAVTWPRSAGGRLRVAEAADWPTVREWAPSYARDVSSSVDVATFFERRLRTRTLYVWDDGGPKCVVAVSGKTPNGVRISAVYTPEQFRNRGYASNAVAGVSQIALDAGCKFCVLFADREPSTPMRIYQNLGYRRLREHLVIDLRA